LDAVAEADVDSWRSIFDVNLYGALYLVKAAVPAMRARGGGAIVLVNSGSLVSTPPALGAYTASKAALAGMARTLAVEVGQWGIRVNGVLLGGVAGENILHAAKWQAAAGGSDPRGMAGEAKNVASAAVHADSGPMCRHRALLLLGSGCRSDWPTSERE
jgi:NAD(P)-dependent dehydrogenase (short-subunit alcohol dehydrogenase family)